MDAPPHPKPPESVAELAQLLRGYPAVLKKAQVDESELQAQTNDTTDLWSACHVSLDVGLGPLLETMARDRRLDEAADLLNLLESLLASESFANDAGVYVVESLEPMRGDRYVQQHLGPRARRWLGVSMGATFREYSEVTEPGELNPYLWTTTVQSKVPHLAEALRKKQGRASDPPHAREVIASVVVPLLKSRRADANDMDAVATALGFLTEPGPNMQELLCETMNQLADAGLLEDLLPHLPPPAASYAYQALGRRLPG